MTSIAAVGFLVGVSTTLMWVQSEARTGEGAQSAPAQISIQELQAKVAPHALPEMQVREPF
jgi:hypothetical protein